MPEHYWPSLYAWIVVLPSARKWGVTDEDISYVLTLSPYQLATFEWGHRDSHWDWVHGGRSTRVEAFTLDGYRVELVLRRDGSPDHESCLVFHARYL